MALIGQISQFVNAALIVLTILIAVGIGLGYYFLKIKKITSKQENINYNSFERRNSMEYVKFDNVLSGNMYGRGEDEGIIVTEKDTAFTAGIRIQGFSFYNASAEEQKMTMISMMNFLKTVESPIQLRQSSKAIDISFTIDKYVTRMEEIIDEIEILKNDFIDTEDAAHNYEDDPVKLSHYVDQLSGMRREIETKDRMVQELQAQIDWLSTIASGKYDVETVSTLFITWRFNPNNYIQDLEKEEVYLKAFTELATKLDILSSALARCNCKCERLSARDIVDMVRRHYHPLTGDTISLEDMVDTAIDSLFISSDSLLELQKEALDDQAYFDMMRQIEDDRVDALERSERKLDRNEAVEIQKLEEATADYNPFANLRM